MSRVKAQDARNTVDEVRRLKYDDMISLAVLSPWHNDSKLSFSGHFDSPLLATESHPPVPSLDG